MDNNNNKNKIKAILAKGTAEKKNEILERILETKNLELINPIIHYMAQETNRSVKERMLLILNSLIPLHQYKNIELMLKSPDVFVRNGAIEIIKASNMPIVECFKDLADDEDKDVRKFVIDSLANDISEESKNIIRRGLEDTEINIVYTAIEHMGNLKDNKSSKKIEEILLNNENLMVICAALEALSKIGVSEKKDQIIEKFIQNKESMIIFPFLRYIGKLGDESLLDYIINVLKKDSKILTKEAIDAIENIINRNNISKLPDNVRITLEELLVGNINEVEQYEIQGFLNRMGGEQSLVKAREMLKSAKEMVILAGIEILAEYGEESDIELLEVVAKRFEESDELLEALGNTIVEINERTG